MRRKKGLLTLNDGATRIFLNSHGKNPEDVSPELVELLNYIEHSNSNTASTCHSARIKSLHARIESLKSSEEVSIKYMQRWEELVLERKEGYEEGETDKLKTLIGKKIAKNKSIEKIAEELEEDDVDLIRKLAAEIAEQDKKVSNT